VVCKAHIILSLCLVKHYAMKAYGGVDPHFLDFSNNLGGQLCATAALPQGKSLQYPLDRRLV
jgi:hypothetical protein